MSRRACVRAVVAVNARKMEGSRVADTLVGVRAAVVVDARRVGVRACVRACVRAVVIACKRDGNDQ